jgi:nicotinamide-nucleotide amidase
MSAAARMLIESLTARALTLAVAESCTGGFICHLLTNVPGSSKAFLGGVVAYDNAAKTALLRVPEADIASSGSDSAEVALAMARGAREAFGARVGLGVTGIAGPGGGTAEKPTGAVFLAVVSAAGPAAVVREHFPGGRARYKQSTAERALRLVREHIDADAR